MADGTEHPIAGIRPGDQVVGRTGSVNRVTGMHIVPLGPRALFGVNQHSPFFTAEHPFLTPGGWRALDRAATRLETPGLIVSELTAGDVLITASKVSGETAGALALAPAVSFGQLVLHRLTRAEGNPANSVYNLILDGDHSYVANGFVVHNKGGEGGDPGSDQVSGIGYGGSSDQGSESQGTDDDADINIAADGTTTTDTSTTADDASTTTDTTTDTADETDTTSTEDASSEFSGSAEPVGADLDADAEKAAISDGWK